MHDELLLHVIGVPAIAGLLCLFMPDTWKWVIRAVALVVSAAALALTARVFLARGLAWPQAENAFLAADPLSAFIGAAIAFFALLIILYSCAFTDKSQGQFFGYSLITLGAALGAAYANNTIVLLVFWGVLAATLYLLANLSGTAAASRAAKKALIIIGVTDALAVFGVAILWKISGSFSMNAIHCELSGPLPVIAYLAIASAALAKAGAVPFHAWLPDIAEHAPAPVTAYLPASIDKLLGIYLLTRASLSLFVMNSTANMLLAAIGAVTIVLAVVLALMQHDMKRLLGYHAVSQVGYMVLGIGTGTAIGIAGALFHVLNHALYKSCLFLTAGAVEKRTGTTDMESLGGLGKYMPVTFLSCLIASLSISGVPPFNGFVSKWMIYQGIVELGAASSKNPLWIVWLVAAMFGSALTVASFMKLLHAVFMSRPSRDLSRVKEVPFAMVLPMAVLATVCAIFGVFAFQLPLMRIVLPAVGRTVAYPGIWTPTTATALIVLGIGLGALVYALARRKRFTYRTTGTFIGGEHPDELSQLSGVDFYNTIRDMKAVGAVYNAEKASTFDIYDRAKALITPSVRFLQRIHNGILPTYMVWVLLGMIGIFLTLFFKVN